MACVKNCIRSKTTKIVMETKHLKAGLGRVGALLKDVLRVVTLKIRTVIIKDYEYGGFG